MESFVVAVEIVRVQAEHLDVRAKLSKRLCEKVGSRVGQRDD